MAFKIIGNSGVTHICDGLESLTLGAGTGLTKSANSLVCAAAVDMADLGDGVLSLDLTGTPPPPAPADVLATDGDFTDKVTITWSAAAGADTYSVYRGVTEAVADATLLEDSIAGLTYDDTTATPGTIYHYWLTATNAGGEGAFSVADVGYIGTTGGGPVDFINDHFFRDAAETPIGAPWYPVAVTGANLAALVLPTSASAPGRLVLARDAVSAERIVARREEVLSGLNLILKMDLLESQFAYSNDTVYFVVRSNSPDAAWADTTCYWGGLCKHTATSYHINLVRRIGTSETVLITEFDLGDIFPASGIMQLSMTITGVGASVDFDFLADGVSQKTYSDTNAARIVTGLYAGVYIRMNLGTAGQLLGPANWCVAVV